MRDDAARDANLDAVRTTAVLLVVASHLAEILRAPIGLFPLGVLGVAFFFVHSGLVNMLSIHRHAERLGTRSLPRAFLSKRALRIYPLSIIAVAGVYFARIIPPQPHNPVWLAATGERRPLAFGLSLLLVQNFTRLDEILPPLWSLPFEMQLYCLFPPLFSALRRARSAAPLLLGWLALAVADAFVRPFLLSRGGIGSVFLMPDLLHYFLWFLPGFYAYKNAQTAPRSLPSWTLAALLGGLCCASFAFAGSGDGPATAAALALGLALPRIREVRPGVVRSACGWIARYSYGIYLLHYPMIWLSFSRLDRLPLPARAALFAVTTLGGSAALYHAVERPMIELGARLSEWICAPAPDLSTIAARSGGS